MQLKKLKFKTQIGVLDGDFLSGIHFQSEYEFHEGSRAVQSAKRKKPTIG